MKPKRTNPLFTNFFRANSLAAAVVLSVANPFLPSSASGGTLYWDVNGATAGSGNAGGSWDSGTNWTSDAAGGSSTTGWVNGESAVFSAGTDGTGAWTATIDGSISTPSILFKENAARTISGGTINIGGGTINTAAASTGNVSTISSVLAGSGGLTIAANGELTAGTTSAGRLLLSGANTISGDITITSGLVTTNSGFGSQSNKIILDGGGLVDANNNTVFVNPIEVGPTGGVYRTWGSVVTGRIAGPITGSGNLRRTDANSSNNCILTISGDASAFAGMLTNEVGYMRLESANWQNATLVQTENNNTVRLMSPGDTTVKAVISDRDLVIPFGSRLNIVNGTYTTVGAGGTFNPFWIQGTSAGNPGSSGEITSSSGTLSFTNGAPTGNLTTSDNRLRVKVVDFNGSTPLTFIKNHYNALAMDQPNTYTGGTIINGGRINVDRVDSLGTGTVTVNTGGQAWLTVAGSKPYANNFVINGFGPTEGSNQDGAIRFNENTLTGNIHVASASRITAQNIGGRHTGALTGSADLEIGQPGIARTLTFSGNTSGFTGMMTLNLNNTLNVGALGGDLTVSGGTANVSGAVAGTATVNSGTLNLASGSSITSPQLNGGTLNVLAGASVQGDLATNNTATVNLAGSVTGNVLIESGDTLGLRGGSVGNGLSLVSTSNLNYRSPVSVTGDLDVSGFQIVDFSVYPSPGTQATLLTYTGSFTGDMSNFEVNNPGSYRSVNFIHDTVGKAIKVEVGSAALTWEGNINTVVNSVDANWAGDNTFYQGDSVTFDDTADIFNLTFGSLIQPESVTFNHSVPYSLTGGSGTGIGGGGGLTKSGSGTLTLGGQASSFTGPVAINAGVLNLSNAEALGYNSGVTIASGAHLNFSGHAPGNQGRPYSYTIAGDGGDGPGNLGAITNSGGDIYEGAGILNLTLSGNAEVGGNNGRFDIGRGGGMAGVINGNGHTLTKVGGNKVVVRGVAANDVYFVVNAGTLTFENSDGASGTNPITVNAGTLGTYGNRTLPNNVTFAADGATFVSENSTGTWTGIVTLNGNTTFSTAGGNLVIDGALAGSGNITRTGGNTLFLQNSGAAYSGKIVNNSGTLRIESPTAIGTATGADVLTLGGTTLEGGTNLGLASATIGSATQGITLTGALNFGPGEGNTLTINAPITGTGNLQRNNNAASAVIFNQPVSSTLSNFTSINGTTEFNQGLNLTWSTDQAKLRAETGTTVKLAGTSSFRELELSVATVNIVSGATVTCNQLEMSQGGGGPLSVVNQSGGTVNFTGTNNTNTTDASFLIGHWGNGSTSTYNLSGGSLNAAGAVMSLGWDSSNVNFNQSGGTANFLGINLNNGRNNTAAYNLTGGRINLGATGITNASNKSVNLGGGTVGAFADWSSTKNITFTGTGGATTVNTLDSVDNTTPRTITLDGVLSGAGGLIKQGEGTLRIENAANSFSGTVRVEDGTLRMNNAPASTNSLELAGGDFRTTATYAASTDFAGGNATFSIGGSGSLLTTGSLTVSSASTISYIPQGQLAVGQEYPVIAYQGAIGGLGLGGLSLNPLPNPRYQASLVSGANEVRVKIDAIDTLVWTNSAGGMAWDTTSANWKLLSDNSPATFQTLDNVLFDGAAAGAVNLNGTLEAATVAVNSSSNYIFTGTGQLGGSTSIVKQGSGVLTLLTANSHSGESSVSGGTLRVGNANSLGLSGNTMRVHAGGTFDLNGQDLETANYLVRGNGGTITNSSTTVSQVRRLQLDADTVINNANPVVLGAYTGGSGVLDLAGRTLTKNGAGQLTLNGVTVGDGSITINQGTVRLIRDYNDNQQAVSITGTGAITINSGASLITDRWGVGLTLSKPIVLNGGTIGSEWPGPNGATIAAPVSVTADSVMNFNGGIAGYGNVIFSGVISGTGRITCNAGGGDTTNFIAANTYSGGTTLANGNLAFENGSLGTGDITMDGGTLAWRGTNTEDVSSRITMVFGKTAAFNTGANNVIFASGIGDETNASLSKSGNGKLTLQGVNTYTGDTSVSLGSEAGTGILRLENGGSLAFQIGYNEVNTRVTGTGTVEIAGSFNLDLSGADITDGNTWTLSNAATQSFESTFTMTSNLGAFTETANVHTLTQGANTWTFDEATGVLSLSVVSSGYNTWAATNAPSGTAGDDFDGDGVRNGVEYVLGGDKDTNDAGKLPVATVSGGNLIFTFKRDQDSKTVDTAVKVEVGTSLATWTDSFPVPDSGTLGPVTVTDNLDGTDTVVLTVAMSPDKAKFARLRVEITP